MLRYLVPLRNVQSMTRIVPLRYLDHLVFLQALCAVKFMQSFFNRSSGGYGWIKRLHLSHADVVLVRHATAESS